MTDPRKIAEAVISGKTDQVKILVGKALAENIPVRDILNKGLIGGMDEVGVKFRANDFYIPEVLIAARAMQAGLDILQPMLTLAGVESLARVAIGTVRGDLHDIGKNLVAMMLKGGGFEVIDLGIDVPVEKFIAAVRENGVQILGLSALLTTTMPGMEEVIRTLEKEGLRAKVKIMVGGAPVTQAYADRIGADAYGEDAAAAVLKAKEVLGLN